MSVEAIYTWLKKKLNTYLDQSLLEVLVADPRAFMSPTSSPLVTDITTQFC